MSQENVAAIRRGFELWNVAMQQALDETTRQSALRQMLDAYHPDAELDYSRTLPDFSPIRGREAMSSWTERAREAFGEVRIEPIEYVDADDAVVARVRMTAKGTSSGAAVGGEFLYVFRYRDERIISAVSYLTMREALKAVQREEWAVSQQNVETYLRGVAGIDGREFSDELFAEICTPEFRMENTSTAVTDKTYHGAEGVREWRSDFFEAFGDEARYENEKIIAHADDFVVSVVRLIGQGARSGAPLELRWVAVTWFEGGKMSRGVGYLNRQEALKAVGLAE